MKHIIVIFAILSCTGIALAQSVDQIKADSRRYLWGEGTGSTLSRATDEALHQLISQISVQVESSFTLLKEEAVKAGKTDFTEQARLIMKTYSSATLHGTERIVINNEPNAHVFLYIARADVTKVFEQRKRKIIDFTTEAEKYAASGQMADALKYYYWALSLLRSHPDANSMSWANPNGQQQLLLSYIPRRMNELFQSLQISIREVNDEPAYRMVVMNIAAANQPVANLEYSYWDGKDWSAPYAAKDGIGYLEFFGDNASNRTETQLRVEYTFDSETRFDRELDEVMKRVEPIPFAQAYVNVKLSKPTLASAETKIDLKSKPSGNSLTDIQLSPIPNPKPYEDKVDKVLASLKTRNLDGAKNLFTPEGFDVFSKLLAYGKSQVLQHDGYKTVKFGETVICRGPKMSFSFSNNTRRFVEDVVFYFDSHGKITTLSFGLSHAALKSITQNQNLSEAERLAIISFMEHYKTAYALKRLDFINSIFADDALIIVGNVVRMQPKADNPFKDNKIVKYNRYNKQQYLRNLEHSFRSNEFINIKFEDNTVTPSQVSANVYGIQIKQLYSSTNYGDQGYLFLLLNLSKVSEPLIHIRTWQPEKNPDGSIYGLEDF